MFTLPNFLEIGSKKSADSKKSGSGTTALVRMKFFRIQKWLSERNCNIIYDIFGEANGILHLQFCKKAPFCLFAESGEKLQQVFFTCDIYYFIIINKKIGQFFV